MVLTRWGYSEGWGGGTLDTWAKRRSPNEFSFHPDRGGGGKRQNGMVKACRVCPWRRQRAGGGNPSLEHVGVDGAHVGMFCGGRQDFDTGLNVYCGGGVRGGLKWD